MAQVLWIIQIISKGLVRTLRFKAHILRMILLGSLGGGDSCQRSQCRRYR